MDIIKDKYTVTLESLPMKTIPASSLFQSGFWMAFKEMSGWNSLGFKVHCTAEDQIIDTHLFVLTTRQAFGYSIAYIPPGPASSVRLPDGCMELLSRALKPHLPRKTMFIRFDIPWGTLGETFPAPLSKPLVKAVDDVQPAHTVIIDLTFSEDELLSRMKPKHRYNMRLAEKKGVSVREARPEELPQWYDLYVETAKRDRIGRREMKYFESLFSLAVSYNGDRPLLHLLFAEAEGRLIAGIILAVFGDKAYYLYGASSDMMRNYMASYLLQWRAMLLAKNEGAAIYDLYGIPPSNDPNHAMHGLYQFKTGFGGEILHRPGCFDYPLKFFAYFALRAIETLRAWHKSFRKRGKKNKR